MKLSSDGKTITFRIPDNWHFHFRQAIVLAFLIQVAVRCGWRRRVAGEPNTVPPKTTGPLALEYRDQIVEIAREEKGGDLFEPVPIMQITESTTPDMIHDAIARGVRIFKVYPFFVTTHSANGVKDYRKIEPALAAVAEYEDAVVQFHGEDPDDEVEGMEKQIAFLKILDRIRMLLPRLKISLEHVGSAEAIAWVEAQDDRVGASITIQHITNTMDDLMGYSQRSGGLMMPHEGCKPQPLRRRDRAAVQRAVLSGNPKFFYGGDDAFHPKKEKKECAHPSCGCWNTIPALPLLIEFFVSNGQAERLEPFISEFGARFYGYPLNEGTLTFVREDWKIPEEVEVPGLNDSGVPMYAGQTVKWKLVD